MFKKIAETWKTNSKFSIHPFKSLHSRHLLPLSIPDYVARFSFELVIMTIALFSLIVNFTIFNHANLPSSADQSVIFSFLKNNPQLNNNLLVANTTTTTVLGQNDLLVARAFAASEVVLTASQTPSPTADSNTMQDGVIVKPNPSDTQSSDRSGITKYQVQAGETINGIASSFGISPETIMKENNLNQNSTLKPGTELTILPTTGITYTLKDGDTLDSILKKYKISEDDFLNANNIESFEDLAIGATIVIPLDNVTLPALPKPKSQFVQTDTGKIELKTASTPADFENSSISFIWPTPVKAITQGFSSRHTGIDISNSKEEPIYAAADGFVEISGYQTNGYGNTIVINHGNGFKTRYGHASELYVTAGTYVKQGQLIAKQGNTGRVRGTTGIHLHFEIIKNGIHVNPLNYVKP